MEVRKPDVRHLPQRHLTELGELPVDWRVVPIGELQPFVTSGSRAWAIFYSESGSTFLRITNLSRECIYPSLSDLRYVAIPPGDSEGIRTALEAGDILISITADIGIVGLVTPAIELPAYINQHIALVRIAENQADARYLAYFLAGAASQRRFKAMTDAGAKAGMNLTGVRQVLAAFPPTWVEQQAVAEALSDADAWIASLSLLLAKKRQIKQCTMHELLTGKKRLPGFSGDWMTRRLDQLADIRSGGTPSTAKDEFWDGDVLWCTPTDITALDGQKYLNDTARKLTSLGMRASAAELIPANSVVMTSRATIGECAINARPVTTNQGFKSFVPFDSVDPEFLYYLLQTQRAGFINLCSGSTFLEMGKAQLSAYEVIVPKRKEEQAAISLALSEMDQGIAVLRAKLGKAKELKQGMMQALLTGRIRLVQPASNVIPLPVKPAAANPLSTQPAHNWQINEAVVIGVLAQRFGTEKFPLPRKRRVKLMYLLHRHAEGRTEGYLKKSAGPYDPNTKYKGPEAIALKNGYVRALNNGEYEGFVAGDKAGQALGYFEQWYGTAALEWLERFHYRKTDYLELLATVDMAMVDLAIAGQPADVAGVKRVIAAHSEWVPKLSRELFSDEKIARAIAECQKLFDN